MKRLNSILAAAAVCTGLAYVPVAGAADLTPQQVAGDAAQSTISPLEPTPEIAGKSWYKKYKDDARVETLEATSPAMNDRKIPLAVIRAKSENRPTIYLLNGAGGAEQDMDWLKLSDAVDFYHEKDVNVVVPQAGAFSYYTDWISEPSSKFLQGPQKWETFLTKELPGAIEKHINADNHRAIAGMSMSATSSLLLAQHNPGFYDAVGSYAGCAATAYPLERKGVELTVNRGGGSVDQMWGPYGSETNRYNDAMMNAEKLRGTELYISSGSGLAGEEDTFSYIQSKGYNPLQAAQGSATLQIEGGAIEAGVNYCTHNFKAKLDQAGVPATYNFRNTGTHSWPHWNQDLKDSWPVFKQAFNI